MKYLIRVAFAVLSLATIPAVGNAATFGSPQTSTHSGPYDNTGNGPGQTGLEGGGG